MHDTLYDNAKKQDEKMEVFRDLLADFLDTLPQNEPCAIAPIYVYRPLDSKVPVDSPVEKSIATLAKYQKAIKELKEIEHLSLPDLQVENFVRKFCLMIYTYTSYIEPICYGPMDIGLMMTMSILGGTF